MCTFTPNLHDVISNAAPSAPRSFTLSTADSTQLEASWAEPDQPNGVITSYTVFCRDNDTTDDFTIFNTVEEPNLMTVVQLTSLSPFTAYECFATASTSAGEGDPSNTTSARTDEAGESHYILIY